MKGERVTDTELRADPNPLIASLVDARPPLNMRSVVPSDLNFILNAWMESYRDSPFGAEVYNNIYYPNHQKLIAKIAGRPKCVSVVATSEDDPNHILGFIIAEPQHETMDGERVPLIVHYAYVKNAMRRLGIAREMLLYMGWGPGHPIVATQLSTYLRGHGRYLMKKFKVIHNPYVVMVDDWFRGWKD